MQKEACGMPAESGIKGSNGNAPPKAGRTSASLISTSRGKAAASSALIGMTGRLFCVRFSGTDPRRTVK
jgi:hypothetical protein